MNRKIFSFLILFILSMPGFVFALEANQVALVMVESTGIGNNLSALALKAASNTQSYQMIVNKIGQDKARKLIQSEILKLRPTYQATWNKNLADSYAIYLNATELSSINEMGENSVYFAKLTAKQNDIGNTMQKKSEKLLSDIVMKALMATESKI